MSTIEHAPPTVDAVTVRRKPALTYRSPAQSTAISYPEKTLLTPESATSTPPLVPASASAHSQTPELSPRSTMTRKLSRMTTALLPLYHPFGSLALSLPDLDPTAFGLPAPVAVFDDPTRRYSNRQRRPAAKVRDTDAPVMTHSSSFVAITVTPTLEAEVREKSSPRRRRGGGPGKRKRREHEDGDATYPAKRPRNPRSSGVALGLPSTRASPALSNAHSGASPALDAGRGDVVEEKKPERRTTRSRGVAVRRDSTASEDTASSASPSVSASNTAVPRVASSGEPADADEPAVDDASNEATAPAVESKKAEADDNKTVPGQQKS